MIEKDSEISVRQQCELLKLCSSTLYYKKIAKSHKELDIMDRMDRIYLQHPYYGSRRMAKQLNLDGIQISRSKIRRLMKIMGIMAIYQRPRTSIPGIGHKIYPYLLKGMRIDKPMQVWCSDITYIRMPEGWVYLVAIMDWYSRKVLTWRLSISMSTEFCVEALNEAIKKYGSPEIFNTDQGSQFTSQEFTGVLKEHGIKISMDGKGRFMDNIFIERLWRTLKYERVFLKEYGSVMEARADIAEYFLIYNQERLHSTLGYKTPDDAFGKVA